jgi:CMP-N-acetylneuraminic acid synthetase
MHKENFLHPARGPVQLLKVAKYVAVLEKHTLDAHEVTPINVSRVLRKINKLDTSYECFEKKKSKRLFKCCNMTGKMHTNTKFKSRTRSDRMCDSILHHRETLLTAAGTRIG